MVLDLPFEQMLRLEELTNRYVKTSVADLMSMLTAQVFDAILVTGDAELRRAAKAENVPVHGVLWLLDEMVTNKVLRPCEAAGHLKIMQVRDRRLPRHECEKRLKEWGNE